MKCGRCHWGSKWWLFSHGDRFRRILLALHVQFSKSDFFKISLGNRGLSPCGFDRHGEASATKTFCDFDRVGLQKCFVFEMHVEIDSVENILHYFDTPKSQGGKPGFEMKLHTWGV